MIDLEQKHRLTEKYFNTVYRLALSQTKDQHTAEDVTQDVFLRFIRTDKDFESEEHIKAWLLKVTVNRCKSWFSAFSFKKTVPLTEEIRFDPPEYSDIWTAVAKLPLKYKTVVHLFYYEDMSVKQISACLSLNEATVKTQLKRGRELLKDLLKGWDNIEF